MNFKIIQNDQDLKQCENIWHELYSKIQEEFAFQSFTWNHLWYKSLKNKHSLFVVILYSKKISNPCMIAPLYIDKQGTLRFIADGHSDYNDFLIDPSLNHHSLYDAFKTLKKVIEKNKIIKMVELRNITQKNIKINILFNQFDNKQLLLQTNAVSYLNLLKNEDFFKCFQYLTSKKRSELKRIYKKNSGLYCIKHEKKSSSFPLEMIKMLAYEMKKNNLRNENFLNETLLGIIESLYNNELLYIMELKDSKNKTLATNLVLTNNEQNHHLLWIDIYTKIPYINIVSYLYLFKHLCENKKNDFTIDFGRGLYEYKIKNFLPVIETQYTFFYAKKEFDFLKYLMKTAIFLFIKNYYKKNKNIINRLLHR